jgi:hypothetical protein
LTVEGLNGIRCDTCGVVAAMPRSGTSGSSDEPPEMVVRRWAAGGGWTTDNEGKDRCAEHSRA